MPAEGDVIGVDDPAAGRRPVVPLQARPELERQLELVATDLVGLGEVAFRGADRHLHEEIAGRNNLCRIDQPADRSNQVIGEIEPDPDRRKQDDQRDHRIHQREGDLNTEATGFELGILRDAGLRGPQLGDDLRVEDARDIKIGIGVGLQLDDRGDIVGIEKERNLRLGLVAGGEHFT